MAAEPFLSAAKFKEGSYGSQETRRKNFVGSAQENDAARQETWQARRQGKRQQGLSYGDRCIRKK